MKDEAALLARLQSAMGAGMFQRTLRSTRLDISPGEEGDGEAIYRGYLQASLLSVISAAFLHPISERRLRPPALSGTLACNHRVGVYDWDPAFDDGSKVTDLSTFEILSQSDVIRFLHARREDCRLMPFMQLTVVEVGLLASHLNKEPRAGDAREGLDTATSAVGGAQRHSSRLSPISQLPAAISSCWLPTHALHPNLPSPDRLRATLACRNS